MTAISTSSFLEDLIDACVMECYFREHMAERDLLFHDTLAPHLAAYAAYAPEASEAQQRDFLTNWERLKYEGRMMKWIGISGPFSSFIIHPFSPSSASPPTAPTSSRSSNRRGGCRNEVTYEQQNCPL